MGVRITIKFFKKHGDIARLARTEEYELDDVELQDVTDKDGELDRNVMRTLLRISDITGEEYSGYAYEEIEMEEYTT